MAVTLPGARRVAAIFAGWRGLRRFWAGVLLALLLVAVVLQSLGPPFRMAAIPSIVPLGPVVQAEPPPVAPAPAEGKAKNAPPKAQQVAAQVRPGRDTPGPTADPDPALLVPFAAEPSMKLPRISVDGRVPMAVYASGFDPTTLRPRVGLLIAGIGMSEADSLAAVKELPEGVTFAVSPYATNISHLLDVTRMTGHEYLLSIPMEPAGYPVNDPDDRHALMTSLPPFENLKRLDWILSRVSGYVGVTNAFGQLHGERLSGVPDQMDSMLEDIAHRGLLFIDCRVGQPLLSRAWNRSVDLVIDDGPIDGGLLDQNLDQLSHMALDRGSALGLVSVPRPVTLARVAAWTTTLLAKGLALAPVSALVRPPAKQESEK
jgi:polysaccharide deacetylase 2 family uncharacterized protein YibQ